MKQIIIRSFLIISSTVLSIFLIIFGLQIYFSSTNQLQSSYPTDWMLALEYSFKHIFWDKPECNLYKTCAKVADKKLDIPKKTYGYAADPSECERIIFIGDSFTINVTGITSYETIIMNAYISERKGCVTVYKLATGGSSTHQQFSRFLEVYKKIDPDIVIWQHYWNDLSEIDRNTLYILNRDGELIRKNTFTNSTIWLGKLLSVYPRISESKLYRHLFYLTVFRDITRYWNLPYQKFEDKITSDEKVLTKIYQEMENLAQKNDFSWYTTLAPLECQFTDVKCDSNEIHQEILRKILKSNTKFISMEYPENHQSETKVLGVTTDYSQYFRVAEEPDFEGWRHLNTKANEYYGLILYQNLKQELFSD